MKDCTNCQICSTYLHKGNVSKAHSSLCKGCYAAVTRYKRYLKSVDITDEQKQFIRSMNSIFVMNEIDGKYVPKVYYTKGRRFI